MELTGRQQVVLGKLLERYGNSKEPLYYSDVANEIGISNVTAYEMLRLLEEKGLLTSEYVFPREKKRGPGRSRIVFYLTKKAVDVMAELGGVEWYDMEGWEKAKREILHQLREGRDTRYNELLKGILLRIPDCKNPILYLAEMITAVLLYLYQLYGEVGKRGLFEKLQSLGMLGEMGLEALGGLIVGISFVERANRRLTSELLGYLQEYQSLFGHLGTAEKKQLSSFTQEVIEILQA